MFLMILGMFASLGRHYMVSNKYFVLGFEKFYVVISSLGFVASIVLMILLSLLSVLM